MSRVMAMARERIRMLREGLVSGAGDVVADMIVGMIRQIHTAIIKDDSVFDRVLSNMTFFLS
jgi:hypothetical protein